MGSLLEVCKKRNQSAIGDKSKKADSCSETSEISEQRVRALEPIQTDWVAIPLEQCIFDPLYRGTLTGKVPDGWSREGWVMVTRDRMHRTDDRAMRDRLQAEIEAVDGEAEAGPAPIRGVMGG